MRISQVRLKNFKRFDDVEVVFRNGMTSEIADRYLLLGDNGTGKTTIMQAIALCWGKASGMLRTVSDFDWPGWVPGRYMANGMPEVEMHLHFTDDEIEATRQAAESWLALAEPEHPVSPAANREMTVRLKGEWVETDAGTGNAKERLCQLKGRYYAYSLLQQNHPDARTLFPRLPGLFWFDQHRSPTTSQSGDHDGRLVSPGRPGVADLRRRLVNWKTSAISGHARTPNWLEELESSFSMVFPGRKFSGLEPMPSGEPAPEDYYFMLTDGEKEYDIEEMSAGEQSVFPMLFEFVRMQIRNCIVLIDEVDLNLHPPLAQSVLQALPNMGQGCQFILTTHSESIASIVSPHAVHRLAGGALCL